MDARAEYVPADKANLVLKRTYDAPVALVFKVWTDPYHLAQWWGPHGYTTPVCEVDLRPGGIIRLHMEGEDGVRNPSNGVVKEVVENERFAFTTTWDDGDGKPMIELLNTVTLRAIGDRTEMTLHTHVLQITQELVPQLDGGMEAGWSESLEKFASVVVALKRAG